MQCGDFVDRDSAATLVLTRLPIFRIVAEFGVSPKTATVNSATVAGVDRALVLLAIRQSQIGCSVHLPTC